MLAELRRGKLAAHLLAGRIEGDHETPAHVIQPEWTVRDSTAPLASLDSQLRLEPVNVVLSGIKAADDGSGALIVRVYETAGRATEAVVTLRR